MALRRPAGSATLSSSSSSSITDNQNAIRLLESLQNDFKCLSMETKKKYPLIKEVRVGKQARRRLPRYDICANRRLNGGSRARTCYIFIVRIMFLYDRRPKRPLLNCVTLRLLLLIICNKSLIVIIIRYSTSSIRYCIPL